MINSKTLTRLSIVMGAIVLLLAAFATVGAYAAGEQTEAAAAAASAGAISATGVKAIASAIAIGLASCGGAIAMGIFGAKTVEGISRQPESDAKIRTNFMLGLVFIETAIIYALLVVILIIFVL